MATHRQGLRSSKAHLDHVGGMPFTSLDITRAWGTSISQRILDA